MYCNNMCRNVRKYGSTFYVGISQIKNGHQHLSMGEVLRKPQLSEPKYLQTKNLCYTIVKNPARVLLPDTEVDEKRQHENYDFVILLSSCPSHATQKP